MTHDELQAIKARAEAATPGPWHLAICVDTIDGRERDDLANIEAGAKDIAYEVPSDDAAFIAHARTDVPALVAEVERLTKITALRPVTVYAAHVHEIARQHGDTATDDAIGKLAASIACERAILQVLAEIGVKVE